MHCERRDGAGESHPKRQTYQLSGGLSIHLEWARGAAGGGGMNVTIPGLTGMWLPNTDASGLILGGRFRGRKWHRRMLRRMAIWVFSRRGKMIVAIGTNDTLASPRRYVLPQTGHGLSGNIYGTDGDGKQIESKPIPNTFDRSGV